MSWYMWGEQQTAFKSQSSPTMRTELRSSSLSAGSKSLYSLSCLIRQKILLHFILNQTGRIVDEIKGVHNNNRFSYEDHRTGGGETICVGVACVRMCLGLNARD